MTSGISIERWVKEHSLIQDLVALRETAWFNPAVAPVTEALVDVGLTAEDVREASDRLKRFAPYIASVFPQTQEAGGIIESPLQAATDFQAAMAARYSQELPGNLWLKLDSHLPISGSIKARGGIHEVLKHAEDLAVDAGLLSKDDDYARLDSDEFRAFFRGHRIAVGSTGNLGLSIGIMSATLGFEVTVHMSSDARQWKKEKLRSHGVNVVEHEADFSVAVEEGRRQAEQDPDCHFIDDENSADLFIGYAGAGPEPVRCGMAPVAARRAHFRDGLPAASRDARRRLHAAVLLWLRSRLHHVRLRQSPALGRFDAGRRPADRQRPRDEHRRSTWHGGRATLR